MKPLKKIALAAIATMALTALAGAPGASATTLEVRGVAQNRAVTFHLTIRSGNTSLTTDTFRTFQNTCAESTIHAETERVFTAAGTGSIGGAMRSLTYALCSIGPAVIHRTGTLSIQWIRGTTNGTVFSSGMEVTEPGPSGITITCTTSNTDIGTLTGLASGQATLDIRATLACSGIGTGFWTATYTVTSPEGLGVVE